MSDQPDKSQGSGKPRSPRHVRSAAKILSKEATRILGKHASRIAEAPAQAIRDSLAELDRLRVEDTDDARALESEAERLDELLHQHASFARKGALRETLENIGIAVMVALGLRSCVYEPFKIPSQSMVPTLRTGDHIFVNKFSYGVQIPFTSTVVGSFLGDIERGDVVVFRFPLDPSEDFIKRTIGLPGDEVRVMGRVVSIKRAGEDNFEVLPRTPLDEKCRDDETGRTISGCQLFEETLGDHSYVVRYRTTSADRNDFLPKTKTFKVPEGHILVMGDNRDESHDSTQWTVEVEAVDAAAILSDKDLRDLTDEKLFTLGHPSAAQDADPTHDSIVWRATHRSRAHDLALSVWRSPPLGAKFMWEALAARDDSYEMRVTTVAALVDGKPVPEGAALMRTLEVGASIDRLVVGRSDGGWRAIALLTDDSNDEATDGSNAAVVELECGRKVCRNRGRLAARLTDAITEFRTAPEKATRELIARPKGVEYGNRWTGRADVRDHYHQRAFRRADRDDDGGLVRLQVFRKPKQSIDVLQDAALRAVGTSAAEAELVPELGERAWTAATESGTRIVFNDDVRDMVVVLDCGAGFCADASAARDLAKRVHDRVPKAASDRRQLRKMLQADDLTALAGGASVTAVEGLQPARNPFDRTRLEATVQGRDHTVALEVWHEPDDGLAAHVGAVAGPLGLAPSDAVGMHGHAGEDEHAYHHVFAVSGSSSVIHLACRKGLCDGPEAALALARRAAAESEDPDNFIDPTAQRPKPFVPMGNVKGRADVIWLPFDRFWLKIR